MKLCGVALLSHLESPNRINPQMTQIRQISQIVFSGSSAVHLRNLQNLRNLWTFGYPTLRSGTMLINFSG